MDLAAYLNCQTGNKTWKVNEYGLLWLLLCLLLWHELLCRMDLHQAKTSLNYQGYQKNCLSQQLFKVFISF
jgi:hypothetical protein